MTISARAGKPAPTAMLAAQARAIVDSAMGSCA